MRIRITKPIRVNALAGEVEVSPAEYERLVLLNACEPIEAREIPEVQTREKRTTKKK